MVHNYFFNFKLSKLLLKCGELLLKKIRVMIRESEGMRCVIQIPISM